LSKIQRETKETSIDIALNPYGSGQYEIKSGIGFFDHMLESFTKHSRFDILLSCKGDLHVDYHHCVEDIGIVLGQALKQEIYPINNINRFGESSVVMDEACVTSTLDISNRPFLYYGLDISGKVGEFDSELVEEFLRAFTVNAGITLHVVQQRGKNKHHIIEATFKSLAIALKKALKEDSSLGVLSTKGTL
jgi:imidazoleglycerol-phosphate dehydratase